MDVVDTLAFLLGRWEVARSIEDHRRGITGSFVGTATFTDRPSDGARTHRCGAGVDATRADSPWQRAQARCDETGELRFGSHTGPAGRSLDYRREDGAAVMVYFADGRPFVDLDLSTGTWSSTHPCGDDLYQIVTVVASRTVVEERWKVRGPTKDYDAVTTLTRAPAG